MNCNCNNGFMGCGNNSWWIILIIFFLFCGCGNSCGCGCGTGLSNNNCGCDNNCGCIRDNKSPFSFFIPKGRLVRKDSVGPFADESSPHGGKELSTRLWETNSLSLSPRIAG